MANKKNLATTQLTASLNATATSVSVRNASVLPTAPFFATIMPANEVSNSDNSEIVSITAKTIVPGLLDLSETPKEAWQVGVSGATETGATITVSGTSTPAYASWGIKNVQSQLGKTLRLSFDTAGSGFNMCKVYQINSAGQAKTVVADFGANRGGVFTMPTALAEGNTGVAVLFYATPGTVGTNFSVRNVELKEEGVSDTLTIARAQKGTTAKAFEADAILTNAIYLDELAFNDGGVLKDSSGSNMTLGAGNLKNMAVGLAGLRFGWMVAQCGTAATGTGASGALALTEEASAGNLLEINAGRVRAKEAGLALVSGACYAKGAAAQVWANIAKYNVAGNSFTRYGRQVWTSTNETAGITLSLPMVPVPMAVGESLTIIGGSSSSYTIGGGGDAYNGIEVLFIPSVGAN